MSAAERDLRALLEAVCEALTVPGDDFGDRRLADRARWARTTIRGALEDDPADVGWNVGYLRRKMAAEEEAASK
ncbi:hypothetical protein [Streptomyces fuscichromogenes]|uniref:Uncharacterized protein n=1 Tax=Streptomyces fuscichromogenes TaxID=1324013 RepID=A0A917XMW9_9ACTN|nr:hypothetical protein [Streptomyces fuscichromogenes]GGN38165.1 hypothetical protein GCM10011578_083270 [Streptomyces fuscichromogenes]